MIRYLLVLVVVGCIAYPWARLSSPQTAGAITSIYLTGTLYGFALTMAIGCDEELARGVHKIDARYK